MPPPLEKIRFQPEAALIDSLFERYSLEDILQHYVASGQASSMRTTMLATQLLLTPVLSPRLCGLMEACCEAIGFTEEVELYVVNDPDINAFALPGGELFFFSGLLETTDSPDEVELAGLTLPML